jgi:hypothetical protein
MEFEAISSAPLLDNKNDWYPTDGAWADVALQKAESSIDSESSCTFTDVGSATVDATVWESLCAEWNGQKATEAEVAEAVTPPNQDPLSTPPYDQLFIDAEQEGLWYVTHPHATSLRTQRRHSRCVSHGCRQGPRGVEQLGPGRWHILIRRAVR